MFEKCAAFEIRVRKQAVVDGDKPDDNFFGRAFHLRGTWDLHVDYHELCDEGESLHIPLPHYMSMIEPKILLHILNYFFPSVTSKGSRNVPIEQSGYLSPSQLAAMHYVTGYIKARCKNSNY